MNMPQTAVLGMHATKPRAVVVVCLHKCTRLHARLHKRTSMGEACTHQPTHAHSRSRTPNTCTTRKRTHPDARMHRPCRQVAFFCALSEMLKWCRLHPAVVCTDVSLAHVRRLWQGGQIVARPIMYVALTYDHRLVDGREAVIFLKTIKEHIEDPRRMLLDL
jgi:hypothetical protein